VTKALGTMNLVHPGAWNFLSLYSVALSPFYMIRFAGWLAHLSPFAVVPPT